jgi:DNA primase
VSRPSPITAARARHRLAEVAARTGVDPYRTAGSVTVRCPLPSHGHPDRTPSLRLHLDDGIFSCFGCGVTGDVVEWVRQTESVDWRDAISILDSGRSLTNAWAGKTTGAEGRWRGVPARSAADPESAGRPEVPDLDRTPPERVYAALEAAWGHYTRPALHDRGDDYLQGRGIDVRALEDHTGRAEVGPPTKADSLVTALRAEGFSDNELVDAGLAHRKPGGRLLSDFYRQRVLIPLGDEQGRICGFIGRNVGADRYAKYKNPPRTAVYAKSVNLYQPLPAPPDRRGQVVVVEGTLDAMAIAIAAIRSGQADRFCPLTQSGRELSSTQMVYVLELHAAPPVLAFDGDAAGQDSAYRHSLAAARQGRAMAVSVLPDDHDPTSWLAQCGDRGLMAWALSSQEPRRLYSGPRPVPGVAFLATHRRQLGRPPTEVPAVDLAGVAL